MLQTSSGLQIPKSAQLLVRGGWRRSDDFGKEHFPAAGLSHRFARYARVQTGHRELLRRSVRLEHTQVRDDPRGPRCLQSKPCAMIAPIDMTERSPEGKSLHERARSKRHGDEDLPAMGADLRSSSTAR